MIGFEKTIKINMLLDFYGALLTNKQSEYMQLYFNDDLSLQEIATIHDVSRNAIYDNIKRTMEQLENYEEKLQLYTKFLKRQEIITKMKEQVKDNPIIINDLKQLEDLD